MVCSVTEGEDKPLKYPLMFRACELVVDQQDRPASPISITISSAAPQPRVGQPEAPSSARERQDRRGSRRPSRLALRGGGAGGRRGCDRRRARREAARRMRSARRSGPRRIGASSRPRRTRWRAAATGWPSDLPAAGGWSRWGLAGGALRRPPRRGRVRPSRDRRQTGAAGDRPSPAREARSAQVGADRRARRHRDRLRRRGARRRRLRRRSASARERGCLTIAFAPCGAEWEFDPPSDDPFVRQELAETALPRALGARPRVLRASRPARGPRGGPGPRRRRTRASSTRSSPRARRTSRR